LAELLVLPRMPLDKLHDICQKIASENDPAKLNDLITELERLLRDEQDGIRDQIKARIRSINGTI